MKDGTKRAEQRTGQEGESLWGKEGRGRRPEEWSRKEPVLFLPIVHLHVLLLSFQRCDSILWTADLLSIYASDLDDLSSFLPFPCPHSSFVLLFFLLFYSIFLPLLLFFLFSLCFVIWERSWWLLRFFLFPFLFFFTLFYSFSCHSSSCSASSSAYVLLWEWLDDLSFFPFPCPHSSFFFILFFFHSSCHSSFSFCHSSSSSCHCSSSSSASWSYPLECRCAVIWERPWRLWHLARESETGRKKREREERGSGGRKKRGGRGGCVVVSLCISQERVKRVGREQERRWRKVKRTNRMSSLLPRREIWRFYERWMSAWISCFLFDFSFVRMREGSCGGRFFSKKQPRDWNLQNRRTSWERKGKYGKEKQVSGGLIEETTKSLERGGKYEEKKEGRQKQQKHLVLFETAGVVDERETNNEGESNSE